MVSGWMPGDRMGGLGWVNTSSGDGPTGLEVEDPQRGLEL